MQELGANGLAVWFYYATILVEKFTFFIPAKTQPSVRQTSSSENKKKQKYLSESICRVAYLISRNKAMKLPTCNLLEICVREMHFRATLIKKLFAIWLWMLTSGIKYNIPKHLSSCRKSSFAVCYINSIYADKPTTLLALSHSPQVTLNICCLIWNCR